MNFRTQFFPPIVYSNSYPKISQIKKQKGMDGCSQLFLIYDECLADQEAFKKWSSQFPQSYAVKGGEKLKELSAFPGHIERISEMIGDAPIAELCIVAAGGGSVGDFSGFVASVFKRGVRLVHVPTTWLAALDSSHGGKTALNVGGVKNQIGTYHPALAIFIVREAIDGLSRQQLESGYGELLKVALLQGGFFYRNLLECQNEIESCLWQFVSRAIAVKYKIVKRDPYEQKGDRQLLNLGHTFGHVLEAYYKLPHGVAVAWGIKFALNWSRKRNYLPKAKYSQIIDELSVFRLFTGDLRERRGKIPIVELERYLRKDKKREKKEGVVFLFLAGVGKPIRKVVTIQQIIAEVVRQGWAE